MAVDEQGQFIVVDLKDCLVHVLDEAGKCLRKFPVDDDMKFSPGKIAENDEMI